MTALDPKQQASIRTASTASDDGTSSGTIHPITWMAIGGGLIAAAAFLAAWLGVFGHEETPTAAVNASQSVRPIQAPPGGREGGDTKPSTTVAIDSMKNIWDALRSQPTVDQSSPTLETAPIDPRGNIKRDDMPVSSTGLQLENQLKLLNQRLAALEEENKTLKSQLNQVQRLPIPIQQGSVAPNNSFDRVSTVTPPQVRPKKPTVGGTRLAAPAKRPSVSMARPIVPGIPHTGEVYGDVGGGHWIDKKTDDGSIIVLNDGSVWQIAGADTIDTTLWLEMTDITVLENDEGYLPYLLVNTDDGEKAEASYMGQK